MARFAPNISRFNRPAPSGTYRLPVRPPVPEAAEFVLVYAGVGVAATVVTGGLTAPDQGGRVFVVANAGWTAPEDSNTYLQVEAP